MRMKPGRRLCSTSSTRTQHATPPGMIRADIDVMTQFVLSVLTLLSLAGGPGIASAQELAIFEGRPLLKVQVSFGNTDERRLTDNESFEFQVRIVERDGRYF